MNNTPPHLGGHCGITHTDAGVLHFMRTHKRCRTLLDIGCGPGGMIDLAKKHGFTAAKGIDGDPAVTDHPDIIAHDFTEGFLDPAHLADADLIPPDLIWTVEFLEHLSARYLPNLLPLFQMGAPYVILTHATPGQTAGHHHVNLQHPPYWEGVMNACGYRHDQHLTDTLRRYSTMDRQFFQNTGRAYVLDL